MTKKKQKVFIEHPLIEQVHHKTGDIKGVHISYVTRTNALPPTLEAELLKGYNRYIYEYTPPSDNNSINPAEIFASRFGDKVRFRKTVIEIGFGDGVCSHQISLNNPDINYLAFDVYLFGVAGYVKKLNETCQDNVIICRYDGEDFVRNGLKKETVDGFNIFFPDPWIKRKQKKRRIINPEFLPYLVNALKPGGFIHTATDIKEYANEMLECFNALPSLQNKYDGFAPNRIDRFKTTFETKGELDGRVSYDVYFVKKSVKLL